MATKRTGGERPMCFTRAEWGLWGPGEFPCQDCTPAYQSKMLLRKRCSFPKVVFVWRRRKDDDTGLPLDELVGVKHPLNADILAASDAFGPYRPVP